jgi:RHS repeat-associated protein
VRKTGQDTTYYFYDGEGRVLGEYDRNGSAIQETVYLDNMPVVVLKQEQGNTVPYYIYADHINTPRVITRANDNALVWRWDNGDPFGATVPDESLARTFAYNPRFPGQLFDAESGLHQNYFRDYDPRTGRYVTSDSIGLQGGVNTYGYVEGNPLSFYDPNGLSALGSAGGVVGTWGGRISGAIVGEAIFPAGGGIPGAVVGGKLGHMAGSATGEWLNNLIMSEKQDRKASHDAYKAYQREGYQRDPNNPCQELRNRAAYLRKLIADRQAHDIRFPNPGWPNGRHTAVIEADQANLARIEKRIKDECEDQCK